MNKTFNIKKEENSVFFINPRNENSRWVACSFGGKILVEGENPNDVIKNVKKITNDYILTFIPVKGASYVF